MTQAYNLSQLANKVNTSGQLDVATGVTGTLPVANGGTGTTSTTFVNAATNVTGTLPVANGGTGAATLTANNVLLGNGTSAVQVVAPGANGNLLTSNGTTWTSAANTLTAAQVGNAYAGLSAGSVGSLVLARLWLSSTTLTYGQTIAGSYLYITNAAGRLPNTGGVPVSGTWRCLGYTIGNDKSDAVSTTLYIRIS
jgi:hypothetical protein